jgi:hypothetical protein
MRNTRSPHDLIGVGTMRCERWMLVTGLAIAIVVMCVGLGAVQLVRGRIDQALGLAFPATAAGCFAAVNLISRPHTQRLDRLRRGSCPQCGYDVRKTPDQCPECGYVMGEVDKSLAIHALLASPPAEKPARSRDATREHVATVDDRESVRELASSFKLDFQPSSREGVEANDAGDSTSRSSTKENRLD